MKTMNYRVRLISGLLAAAFGASALAQSPAASAPAASAPAAIATPVAKAASAPAPAPIPKGALSYAVGVDMARNLKHNEIDLDIEQVIKGLRDASEGKKLTLSENDVRKVMSAFQADLRSRLPALRKKQGDEALAKGAKFLDENKKKPGVLALDGGLQYKIVKAGTGAKPKATDTVVAQYRGLTLDGIEFDATEVGNPASFKLDQVIEGWKRVLPLLQVGTRATLWIPGPLAYGERGAGAAIGPNELLIFDVEIIAVK